MTVSSLWKVLDSAGCGKPIGINEIVTQNNNNNTDRPTTLAIDLSIWICESMTTYGIHEQHANPTLHLVFTRTIKLLQLGLHLVFVIEGKQRQLHSTTELITNNNAADTATFRKRRSGTIFWKACNDCQQMLELLGVPVVRAKSEGEALCALLSKKGIVDGVISNDGDCLLFGAKVIYTKYSNENLDNGRVMRYDANSLHANTESNEETIDLESRRLVQFSKYDLIAFAILTGSDLSGSGFDKVGYKKAVRFILKCHTDNPLSMETAAYDEMKSWAKGASANVQKFHFVTDDVGKCCTRCNHGGSKRSHMKDGCAECGTGPNEACYHVTSEDRLRLSLRNKALAMNFDAEKVFDIYLRPNENQLPVQLLLHGIKMKVPKLNSLMKMNLIVKGHTFPGSRAFVRQAVLRLLSRNELHRTNDPMEISDGPCSAVLSITHERPIAKAINKTLVHNHIPSYEITWVVRATLSDENGDDIDGYEYVTIESQTLVDTKLPQLVQSFKRNESIRNMNKQGEGMQHWRRNFLQKTICFSKKAIHEEVHNDNNDDEYVAPVEDDDDDDDKGRKNIDAPASQPRPPKRHCKSKLDKKRDVFFENKKTFSNVQVIHKKSQTNKTKHHLSKYGSGGDDIRNLLRFVDSSNQQVTRRQPSPIKVHRQQQSFKMKDHAIPNKLTEILHKKGSHVQSTQHFAPKRHPPHVDFENKDSESDAESIYCTMGAYSICMTPILSNNGIYPPIHIFIRKGELNN